MSIPIDLKEIERRANYAVFQDGLTEIAMGLFLFFYGGSLTVNALPLGFVCIMLAVFLGKPLIERIKRQHIYPRTGYVKLPDVPQRTGKEIGISAVVMVIVLLGALGISMAVMGQEAGLAFFLTYIVPPASGFMLAIGPYWLGQTYGLTRGYIWAILFVIGGIALPVLEIASGYEAVGLLCSVMGLLILFTGMFMFLRFIRKYAPEPLDLEEQSHAS